MRTSCQDTGIGRNALSRSVHIRTAIQSRKKAKPQTVITTTPKPTKLIKMLAHSQSTYLTQGTTYDNRSNLAPAFFHSIIAKYEGTRLGRQELNAEILAIG